MNSKKKDNKPFIFIAVSIYIILSLLSVHMGIIAHENPMYNLMELLSYGMSRMSSAPFDIFPLQSECFTYFGIVTTFMAFAVSYLWLDMVIHKHDRSGKEFGNAHFNTDYEKHNREFAEPKGKKECYGNNMILTQNIYASLDDKVSRHNNNVLVVGGSGSGKTYSLIKPNILQCNTSYVVTDPNGEILNDTGYCLEKKGYKIKVLDLTDMTKSNHYNPLKYIKKEEDVLSLVTALIKNTNESGAKGGDPFWEKSETALYEAIIFYLLEQDTPVYPVSFHGVITLINMASPKDESSRSSMESPLDALIFGLEASRKAKGLPCMAARQYKIFKQAGDKTAKGILISAAVRLSAFNFPRVAALTNSDDMELDKIGDEKTALFIITPTGDNTYGFITSIMYTQLFNSLYYHAEKECAYCYTLCSENGDVLKTITGDVDNMEETKKKAEEMLKLSKELHIEESGNNIKKYIVKDKNGYIYNFFNWKENAERYIKQFQGNTSICLNKHGRALPIYTRFLMDEFANIGQIPDFQQKISTTRKYYIGLLIILQNISQLEALYDKDSKTIIGNCDYFLWLGGNEQSMLEYVSKLLGETTITVRNTSSSKGKGGGNMSYNQTKVTLATPDQIGTMDRFDCILKIANDYPFLDKKFNLIKHKNYKNFATREHPERNYHFIKITDDVVVDENKMDKETEKLTSSYYESRNEDAKRDFESATPASSSYSKNSYQNMGKSKFSSSHKIFTQTEAAEMARQAEMKDGIISKSLVLSSESISQSFSIESSEDAENIASNIILNSGENDNWDFSDVF